MSHRPYSVVLGAGLMGRLLAWRLVQAGHLGKKSGRGFYVYA